MIPFDPQRAFDARIDDLKDFIEAKLEPLDALPDLVKRVDKVEKDITRIKAYWTAATVAVGLVAHQLRDMFAAALGWPRHP